MDTETVRLNVTLPKGLVEAMNRVAEPRKRSRFIAEAARQKIEQKEKEETEKLLVEGYQIRTLDKSRLVKLIGELGITEIEAIEKALKIHFEL